MNLIPILALALAQPDARFVAHTTAGAQPAAPLSAWGDDMLTLRREGVSIPPPPTAPMVRLTTGEQILLVANSVVTLDEETLSFVPASVKPASGTTLQVPLATVSLVSFKMPSTLEAPMPFVMKLTREARTRDRVMLANGDEIVGTVTGLGMDGCKISVEGVSETIPPARLAVIAFGTELQTKPRIRGAYQRLVLADGDRIHLHSARLDSDGKTIVGQTAFGQKVSVDAGKLVALWAAQGAAEYLSELSPAKYEATPFLGIDWPLFRDEDGRGGPLRIGADVFDRGLALHSPAAVTYTLDGKYRWFEAIVAVGGAKGRVRFEVLIDGKASKETPPTERTSSDAALPLRIDVRGAKTLTLRAHVGTFGDVQGMSLWGDARLVR